MKLELDDSEINEAIVNQVALMGINTEGKNVKVELKVGRGDNGNTASIEITKTIENRVEAPTENKNTSIADEVANLDAEESEDSLFDEG